MLLHIKILMALKSLLNGFWPFVLNHLTVTAITTSITIFVINIIIILYKSILYISQYYQIALTSNFML